MGVVSLRERIKIWFEVRTLLKWQKLTRKMLDMEESFLMFWYLVDRHNEMAPKNAALALAFKHRIPEHLDIIGLAKDLSTDAVKAVGDIPEFMEKMYGRRP